MPVEIDRFPQASRPALLTELIDLRIPTAPGGHGP
jgi:hypothetical protein